MSTSLTSCNEARTTCTVDTSRRLHDPELVKTFPAFYRVYRVPAIGLYPEPDVSNLQPSIAVL